MHKIVNKNAPDYLVELIPKKVGECAHSNVRNKDDIRNIFCRTSKYSTSFIPDTIRLWNELDIDTRNTDDINLFKSSIMPSRSKNVLFCHGVRKWNVIHAQMRMGCSNLKAHIKSYML